MEVRLRFASNVAVECSEVETRLGLFRCALQFRFARHQVAR